MKFNYNLLCKKTNRIWFKKLSTSRAVASGGAGGTAPPPEGLLPPPRTFTRLITEGQLEHCGINT